MGGLEHVKPYTALVGDDILFKWNGSVLIWSAPESAIESSVIVDEIKKPVEATVLELQKDTRNHRVLRARIRYGEGKEGWVLYNALVSKYRAIQCH